MHWLWDNRQWVFSGAGVTALVALFYFFRHYFLPPSNPATTSVAVSAGGDVVVATGSKIQQTVNTPTVVNSSPTINLSLPAPPAEARARAKYEEWRELIKELHESLGQIGYAFYPILAISPDGSNDYEAGIRRGFHVIRNRILIAEPLKKARILEEFEEMVQYAVSAHNPRDPNQHGCPTMNGFDMKASAFEDELMEIARKDVAG